MADDMYPVGGEDQAEPQGGGENESGGENGNEGGETALLPTSILAGKKFNVGDEVVLKIVHMGDGEIEVTYAPAKAEAEPEPGEKPEMGAAEGDMMAMMKGQ